MTPRLPTVGRAVTGGGHDRTMDHDAPLLCRTLGCRWRYRSSHSHVHRECVRRCGATQSEAFRRPEDAERLARYLGTEEPTTTERLLSPLARLVDDRRRVRGASGAGARR